MSFAKSFHHLSLLALAAGAIVPARALGQDTADAAATAAATTPVCMARPFRDVPQVRAERRGQPFHIVTVERAVPGLEAKGFARVDCTAADLARGERRSGWRDEICKLASEGNEAVQNQLERAYGEKPAVLCAMAEAVAGQWERPRIRQAG